MDTPVQLEDQKGESKHFLHSPYITYQLVFIVICMLIQLFNALRCSSKASLDQGGKNQNRFKVIIQIIQYLFLISLFPLLLANALKPNDSFDNEPQNQWASGLWKGFQFSFDLACYMVICLFSISLSNAGAIKHRQALFSILVSFSFLMGFSFLGNVVQPIVRYDSQLSRLGRIWAFFFQLHFVTLVHLGVSRHQLVKLPYGTMPSTLKSLANSMYAISFTSCAILVVSSSLFDYGSFTQIFLDLISKLFQYLLNLFLVDFLFLYEPPNGLSSEEHNRSESGFEKQAARDSYRSSVSSYGSSSSWTSTSTNSAIDFYRGDPRIDPNVSRFHSATFRPSDLYSSNATRQRQETSLNVSSANLNTLVEKPAEIHV